MSGKYRLTQAAKQIQSQKADRQEYFPGLLGHTVNSVQTVEVPGRRGYVYVRLLHNQNKLIEALNDVVAPVYDLPVLVAKDELDKTRFRVVERNLSRYQNWGSSYVPRHGNQHSFSGNSGGGGDVVWVYGRQFMPLMVHPSGTYGANNVVIEPYSYYWDGGWRYAGGTGTSSFLPYKPTGGNDARMVLLYLDDNTNPTLLGGDTYFNSGLTGTSDILPYVPGLPTTSGIPLSAIRLVSGTSVIGWDNIYDLRPFIVGDGFIQTGTSSSRHVIQNEGTPLTDRVNLNFIGNTVWAVDDAGNNRTNIIISGSVAAGGGHTIQNEGTPLTQRTNLNFVGDIVWAIDDAGNDASNIIISGSFATINEARDGFLPHKFISPATLPVFEQSGTAGGYALIRQYNHYNENMRGNGAVDLQAHRSSGDQVAGTLDSVICGGNSNKISGFGDGFIGGGNGNTVLEEAATIVGGYTNTNESYLGAIGGGELNYASGTYSVIPGGLSNDAAGNYAFATGRRAKARAGGVSVFADSNNFDFISTTPNEFSVRATGGVKFVTAIDGSGNSIPSGTVNFLSSGAYFGGNVSIAGNLSITGTVRASNCYPSIERTILSDEFISYRAEEGEYGELGWNTTASTGGTLAFHTGSSNHPGCLRMITASSWGSSTRLHMFPTEADWGFVSTDIEQLEAILAVPRVIANPVRFGMGKDTSSATFGTDSIYFELNLDTHPNWRSYTRAGSTTEGPYDTGIPGVNNYWYQLKIRQNPTTGDWEFYINNILVSTHTTQKPDTNMGLGFFVSTVSGSVVANLVVDYFSMKSYPYGVRYT